MKNHVILNVIIEEYEDKFYFYAYLSRVNVWKFLYLGIKVI